jgi:phosphatidyl-myo-inositol dimannoside synthase
MTDGRATPPSVPRPLLIGNDFPPDVGGIQQYVAAVAARLPDVAVVAGAHPDAAGPSHDDSGGYPVWRGHRRFLWPTTATRELVHTAIRRHRARCALFTAPFPLPPLGPRLPVPYAVLCHGAELVWPAAMPIVAATYRRWLSRAACLFAVSRYTAGHLRRLVGPDGPPIRIAHPGVDLDVYRPAPAADRAAVREALGVAEGPLVVTVGRLVPRKGTDVLIRALPRIRRAEKGARVVVVGGGRWRRRLERLAARRAPGAVVFAGRMDATDVPALYAAADVAAMPVRSRWWGLEQEGFGMVFVEAQACGVPVVAGRSGGVPETLLDGRTGIVVDGTSPDEVADAVIRLLREPDLRGRMAAQGRAHARATFDWAAIVARLHGDLTEIAEGRTPPRDV